MVVSAVLCVCNDWNEIEHFGQEQVSWLKKHGPFFHGIPSYSTINRVFSLLSPVEFSSCFSTWVLSVRKKITHEVVAIDGKRLCNSYDHSLNQPALHMVLALAVENGLCLGQIATVGKSNEIKAIEQLLPLLDIKGDIVTIDAMGCQKNIAKLIITGESDYILAVKGNQPTLEEGIVDTCRFVNPTDEDTSIDFGLDRIETRHCSVYTDFT